MSAPTPTTTLAELSAATATCASSGKQVRLGRIFGDDGRTVVLPVDHGTMLGRVSGLEDPVEMMRAMLPLGCDAFLVGPGVARRTAAMFARRGAPARLLTVDTHWRDGDAGRSVLMTSLERAAALGVDAVKMLLPWDVPPGERAATAALVGEVVGAADLHGIPVMVEPICLRLPRGDEAVAVEADGCRMAVELGADIVKVAYPGRPEVLATWCDELEVPVVVLGGPASGTTDDLCEMVAGAIAAGARGITIGRRIWQRPLPEATELLDRLVGIVHPDRAPSGRR
ncbi:MAG TPA: hypothetical protein VND23_06965 [Acidimicrobiales bacterium]|nr:hypothetical protein [Acidimicrobiales bacterium]